MLYLVCLSEKDSLWVYKGVMCWTISWPGTITSWSFVVTLRLPGNQWRLQEFTAHSQESK